MQAHQDPKRDWHVATTVTTLPRIIGLQGYGSAGKSEVRKILERCGYGARHIKAPIAEMTAVLLRAVGIENVRGYIDGGLKRAPITLLGARSATDIQQFLGTEFGRDFIHPDIWLDIWCKWADGELSDGHGVVQESVRFANEAAAIRARGGVIIEVRRPGVGPVNNHESEALPIEPDVVVNNNGTLGDLEASVWDALRGVE